MIFEQNGLITGEQYCYLYEVIKLCRWRVEPNHDREFAICNYLIAKNILWHTDANNTIEYQ